MARASPQQTRLTLTQANDLLRAVRVDRFPIIVGYRGTVVRGSPETAVIEQTVLIRVADRDDPTSSLDIRFGFVQTCTLSGLDRHNVLLAVRQALHSVVTHELDECLLVDGARAFDPHDSSAKPS
jgi:hypothetical protein